MILALTIFATCCLVMIHRGVGRFMVEDDPDNPGGIFIATTILFAAPITMLWVLYARIP